MFLGGFVEVPPRLVSRLITSPKILFFALFFFSSQLSHYLLSSWTLKPAEKRGLRFWRIGLPNPPTFAQFLRLIEMFSQVPLLVGGAG